MKKMTYKEWAKEAFEAYEKACNDLEKGASPISNKYEIFRHAPILASIKRAINGNDRVSDRLSVVKVIENDFTSIS